MTRKSYSLGLGVCLVSVLWLDGCASPAMDPSAADSYRERSRPRADRQRERELQSAWKGKPYYALLNTFGTPKLIMNVPGYRPLKTSVVVYGVQDGASNCVDAFTVVKHGITEEWTVSDYFCR